MEIGDKVKIGKYYFEIVDISEEPYIEFKDGSTHYFVTLYSKEIGHIFMNDAQIKEE